MTPERRAFLARLGAMQAKARQVSMLLDAADGPSYSLDVNTARRLSTYLEQLLSNAPGYVEAGLDETTLEAGPVS